MPLFLGGRHALAPEDESGKLWTHEPQLTLADSLVEIQERPRVAAYLASERRIPFNDMGIFRHYPALDVA